MAAVIAAIAVAAGCGDDGDSASSAAAGSSDEVEIATSSLTKPQFISKASALCVRLGQDRVKEASAYLAKHSNDGLSQDTLFAKMIEAVLLPGIEAQNEAIRELGAPAGDEQEVEALLDAQQATVDEVKKGQSVESLVALEREFDEATQMFYDYGFSACVFS